MRGDHLTYGSYLRVPELLELQSALADPPVRDELLFIIGQQAQELWFKQMLFDLRTVIELLEQHSLLTAVRLLGRINRVLVLLGAETALLETLPPDEFHRFRAVLKSASGFESQQFRELELASGLRDEQYLKMVGKFVDLPAVVARWPVSLRDAFLAVLSDAGSEPLSVLVELYDDPDARPDLHALADALSEYELRFQEWRFRHFQLVERVIGDRSPGTGGSAGSAYLLHTLSYRFFPELWEARNVLSRKEALSRATTE